MKGAIESIDPNQFLGIRESYPTHDGYICYNLIFF